MTSRGHFFSKWATSRGHCQRVTSRGHFLVTSRGRFSPREVLFLGDFLWTFLCELSWTFLVTLQTCFKFKSSMPKLEAFIH